jgi:hypothetical protein
LPYAAASACSLRATSVWLECTSAEQSAVCFEPMGMSPSPFSNWVPCTHSLCRIPFLGEEGSICAQSFDACSICLDPSALRFWSLSVLSSGRRLRSLFAHGHCAVRASPSTFGYALLAARAVHACLLRGVSDWNPARLQSAHSFAWVQCRSVADASSLSRMSALLTGSGAICAQIEVCHYRGDQLAGRHLLMRFRSSVSIAPVLSDMCSADLGDSAPPLVTLMATPRPMRLAMLACSRVMRLVEVLD